MLGNYLQQTISADDIFICIFFLSLRVKHTIHVAGTLFLEVWKRKQAELAYQWDVEQFEENEPDRPSFYGTKTRIVCFHLIHVSVDQGQLASEDAS